MSHVPFNQLSLLLLTSKAPRHQTKTALKNVANVPRSPTQVNRSESEAQTLPLSRQSKPQQSCLHFLNKSTKRHPQQSKPHCLIVNIRKWPRSNRNHSATFSPLPLRHLLLYSHQVNWIINLDASQPRNKHNSRTQKTPRQTHSTSFFLPQNDAKFFRPLIIKAKWTLVHSIWSFINYKRRP